MTSRWRTLAPYLVRVAGFAFDRLAGLRCERAAEAAETLERAVAARERIGHRVDAALGAARYADQPAFDDAAVRKAFSKHLKQARAFARQAAVVIPTRDPDPPAAALREVLRVLPALAPELADLVAAHVAWQGALAGYATAFAADFERARVALRTLYLDDERLQEAMFLESPDAFERLQQLLAATGPRNARARQRERLAAMYAQRFCAKNDTNSICGPHGVAYTTAEPAISAAGITIVREDARRETYFSHWAAQRLLDVAIERAGVSARRTVQLHPSARVEPTGVAWCVMDHDATSRFRRTYARSELVPAAVAFLRTLAAPHADDAVRALGDQLALGDDLEAFVEELVAAGILVRGPVLAPGLFFPLQAVRDELMTWQPSDARAWALTEVAAMEALVAAYARASLAERVVHFRALVARFEAATGDSAQRGAGKHYADRSLVHEDSYVEVTANLGAASAVLQHALPALVAVLELPLELARERMREWFRGHFGEGLRIPALAAHRAFDEANVFATPAASPRAALLRDAMHQTREVVAAALAASGGGAARISTAALHTVLDAVPLPRHAGYISVDVMANRHGDRTELVLGEVHGFFWLPTSLLDVLPDAHRTRVVDAMRDAVRAMASGVPTAECVFLHTQATDRRIPIATQDLQLVTPGSPTGGVNFGALELQLDGDEFRYFDGDVEVIPLVAYTNYPFVLYTSKIAPLFDDWAEKFFPDVLLPPSAREGDSARLCVDELVVRRRFWRRSAGQLKAALAADSEAELFRRAQTLRCNLDCEPQVFAMVPGEPKPVLLDFLDVFLLEAFVNLLESQPDGAIVKLSEMLPGPQTLLATGPDGARTSELRMGFYRLADAR